jgi:hypothetical protein
MFSNIKAARLLGWTSIAVGVTELVATKWLEEEIGVDKHEALIRGFGVREIAAGVMILNQPGLNKSLAAGLWSRVVGDALDIFTLAEASYSTRNSTGLANILAIVLAVTGMDIFVASKVQADLTKAKAVATRARHRVKQTSALPTAQLLRVKGTPVGV